MRLLILTGAAGFLFSAMPFATAQQTATTSPATSAGPGRITCATARTCQLGIGNPATLKYRINIEGLAAEDRDRLGKQCKPAGKTPCIVTIDGTEMADPVKLKAAKIKWYN